MYHIAGIFRGRKLLQISWLLNIRESSGFILEAWQIAHASSLACVQLASCPYRYADHICAICLSALSSCLCCFVLSVLLSVCGNVNGAAVTTLVHPSSSTITCGGEQHTTQLSALATSHTLCWSGARGSGFLSPDHYIPAPAHKFYSPDCASWWNEKRERE